MFDVHRISFGDFWFHKVFGGKQMPWVRVTLSESEIVAGKEKRLKGEFQMIYQKRKAPFSAVMYGNYQNPDETVFYFAPSAEYIARDLLKSWQAVECERPTQHGNVVEVGHPSAINMLEVEAGRTN
jgi:hypothetical protein